ncbi:MAG TPA: phosphodiester glycosidase family protein [Tepidisphaeraceae bacterium]|nr:phosphodiester glycosidase family protein [Tepidisphaeraceae bacterium]
MARARTSTTRPMPGVTLERVAENDPPLKYFVVSVNLSDPRVHLKVSRGSGDAHVPRPWETTLMPVSQMAQRDGLSVAVNGNLFAAKVTWWIMGRRVPYFLGNLARVHGWAMSDGALYSANPYGRNSPSLVINDRGDVRIGRFDHLPTDARNVVSGIAQIVTDGRNTAALDSDGGTFSKPAPRTAVGIDRQGKTLILFVADGERPDYSVGITHHHMAQEMIRRAAWDAIALDGGGSTTLVMRNSAGKAQVVNYPSDGNQFADNLSVERSVANALGVVIDGAATRPSK